ncbi:MAG: hypothetical protein E7161_03210 [Firmicutes bacterium]|nr:hypothetical protein [Bacillota bacterium]
MKNILNKFKINNYTYLFLIICALCGYIKNITVIFVICLIHELGHVFFINLFKYKIISIELLPFGGFTTIDKRINTNINKDIIIAFGGIFFQLILMLVVYLFKNDFNVITYNIIIKYNIILLVFNFIPIIPLDGNNILHLILEKIFSYHLSYYINFIISIISLIIFVVINYIYSFDNYFIISFLIYKSVMYIKNYKYIKKRFLLERYLYDFKYRKIENNTQNINSLKKEVLHYFKENNKYIKEQEKIKKLFSQNNI